MTHHKNHKHHSLDNWLRFLEWFCPNSLLEGIQGDLLEAYELNSQLVGERKAKRIFIQRLLKFFRPAIILRNKFAIKLISTIMWRSYFTITWRNLLKSKGYSLINIFGLSLGIACFLQSCQS